MENTSVSATSFEAVEKVPTQIERVGSVRKTTVPDDWNEEMAAYSYSGAHDPSKLSFQDNVWYYLAGTYYEKLLCPDSVCAQLAYALWFSIGASIRLAVAGEDTAENSDYELAKFFDNQCLGDKPFASICSSLQKVYPDKWNMVNNGVSTEDVVLFATYLIDLYRNFGYQAEAYCNHSYSKVTT